ncbi:MAG: peptidyl-prolyl cis-trans isomerase [Candidatus Eiseniibacteriota bacterium]
MLKLLRMGNKRTKTLWWILIVVTVVTFLGGFVFLVGVGFDTSLSARSRGDLGTVNGARITRPEFANALAEQRQAFLQQTGSDPDPEETKALETQAWRGLVTQQLLRGEARRLGLRASDREVLLSLQSSPPPMLAQSPAFQTDGKFDPQKYVAALRNPDNNWAPFEQMTREQLPLRKLQERLLASLKLSEPELRQAYRDRFERVGVTVLQIAPSQQANVPAPTEAEIERAYQKYRGRFASGPRTQLELLQIPIRFSEEEVRAAREQVQGLADRVRRGEDFAALVRDYSEGPGAGRGGEINRVFQPQEFGPAMEAKMAALKPGDISEVFQDGPYWLVLKVISRIPDPLSAVPNLRVAQLAIRIRAGEESMREQTERTRKVRDRAARVGLGRAAAEIGLATGRTGFYDYNNAPPELVPMPEAADWGLSAKQGAVSHVIQGPQEFLIAQVAAQRGSGVPPREEIVEQLRQIAQVEARIALAKPAAQQAGQAIAAGARLEDAAKAAGATVFTIESMSRAQPDQRLAPVPEVLGAAFAAPPGRTIGPIQTLGGWFLVRVDKRAPADPAAFDPLKAEITQDIIGRRQQAFFARWLAELRANAKVQDFRGDAGI